MISICIVQVVALCILLNCRNANSMLICRRFRYKSFHDFKRFCEFGDRSKGKSNNWLLKYDYFDGFIKDYTTINDDATNLISIGEAETYGEVLPEGIRNIINTQLKLSSNDIFYDLGSGIGKTVAQFAYESVCGKCVGIELGESRHNQALQALGDLVAFDVDQYGATASEDYPSKKIVFLKGDCSSVSWSDATVVFINALCFPEDLWLKIKHLIINCTPNLRYLILAGKEISAIGSDNVNTTLSCDEFQFHQRFTKDWYSLPASWSDDYICLLFSRH